MSERSNNFIRYASHDNRVRSRLWQVITALSLLVILGVFWGLKLTGITLAGEAFCGQAEHVHSEECGGQRLICPMEETEEHTHTEECYETVTCPLEEHIHVESCYSDITADLETEDDWEMSLAGIQQRPPTTAETVVLVAQSQLGQTESLKNFEVDAHGVRRGITRYGQWYGNPYGDWSAMFASFCLYYAGADTPTNAGPEAMRLEWEEEGLYRSAEEFAPRPGDLLFLNLKTKESADTGPPADSVAIITGVSDDTVTVIQGDVDGAVAEVAYDLTDPAIVGYGLVPETSGFAALAAPPSAAVPIATAKNYTSSMLTSGDRFLFYTTSGDRTYAIDGNGNAVEVYVDGGQIYADVEDPNLLLWTISTYNSSSYAIQNAGSGRYLHPFYNSSSDNGITTPGRWGTSVSASGTGVKFSHSAYITLNTSTGKFAMNRTQSRNVTFQIGVVETRTVWLDGTNGGLMSLGGSDNLAYTVSPGGTLTLPTQWKSPEKYEYALRGWYDLVNHRYYQPGDTITVDKNLVLYADWVAATYDIGRFNEHVTDTVSTNSFVTTRVFDYGALFNLLSETVTVSVDAAGHTETWSLLTSGDNPYNGEPTLNFIFRDWDRGNEDISYPQNHNGPNNPTEEGTVYRDLYTDTLRELLFNPETEVIGKQYLGSADHLFQLCTDPNHEHYGYYYYNSERNAASYNQSDQRFYVYDYLECTQDSANGNRSDFLPLNSPYVNTNGKEVVTYTYEGVEGEYEGTTHYMYDSKYNSGNNTTGHTATNYWFGMSVDVSFYLPLAPGGTTADGSTGNKDVYGNDMHFRFTGDDDVWIFVDDTMVLDLGGLHGSESGDINFSTGVVTINGEQDDELTAALRSIAAGEHTLTLYYLERGSSLSNCSIYFNLAPRFDFTIQKEDVLTCEVLNGAQFSVFIDQACTVPAQLWESKEAHDSKQPSTNVFTVKNGVAHMWGMGAGNTYYIRETKPPDDPQYGFPNGLICLTFDKTGTASYNVEVIDDGQGISPGFIVHGFRIDAETQQAYIVATNAPKWVKETTVVQVLKHWNDALDHTGTPVTVYLTVTDPDGRVQRIQEAVLSDENNWTARWDNLPKYWQDGVTPVEYGVEESYVSGYYSTVKTADGTFEVVRSEWQSTTGFTNGRTYLLKNADGLCLSTQRYAEDTGFMWVSENAAKASDLALWTASVRNNTVRLTNHAGQTLTFWYGNGSPTDFFALNQHVEDNNRKQYLNFTKVSDGITLKYSSYYVADSFNGSQKFNNTRQSAQALRITPYTEVDYSVSVPVEDQGFLMTNTPLDQETSLTVRKDWVIPPDMDAGAYEQEKVTVRLLANGVDTGRTVTLSLKNSWEDTFRGLPYVDNQGQPITYTVKEVNLSDNWIVSYGEVIATGGAPPNYSVTVTNTYRVGGPVLPATGSPARLLYILCGGGLMLASLVYGLVLRRKRERRRE